MLSFSFLSICPCSDSHSFSFPLASVSSPVNLLLLPCFLFSFSLLLHTGPNSPGSLALLPLFYSPLHRRCLSPLPSPPPPHVGPHWALLSAASSCSGARQFQVLIIFQLSHTGNCIYFWQMIERGCLPALLGGGGDSRANHFLLPSHRFLVQMVIPQRVQSHN